MVNGLYHLLESYLKLGYEEKKFYNCSLKLIDYHSYCIKSDVICSDM
jgi:hypothetical protein